MWAALGVGLLCVLVLAVAALPGVRTTSGVVPAIDDWIQVTGYLAAATLAVGLAVTARSFRVLWWVTAAAVTLRGYGFVHSIFVLDRAPVYPSLADAAWLASGVLLVVAAVEVARYHLPDQSRTLAVDALIGGVTAVAVATALLAGTFGRLAPSDADRDVVVVNLAYPVLDVCLLAVVAGLVGLTHARISLGVATTCLGVVLLAVVDAAFLYQVTHGSFEVGSILAAISLLGTLLIPLGGWLPVRPPPTVHDSMAGLVVPVLFALVCLGVLAADAAEPVPPSAILLAATGVLLALFRAGITYTGDRRESAVTIAAKDEQIGRYQALVEASNDYIGIGTLKGEILYLNPAARRMVGMDPDEPLENFTIARALTDQAAVHQREVERPQIMATGSWQGESTLRNQSGDGPPVPVYKNTFVIRDEAGAPWLLGTIQRDITELKEAESYVERFRSLVEASSDFIALAELDGTVRYLNPAGRRMVGLAPEADVEETSISDFLTEEGLRASIEVEQPAVVADGEWRGESTLRDLRGGPPIPVTINSFLIRRPETGEPWLLATVQRNITELHAVRTELQRLADERQELLRHLVDAQEAERARIAADVHDDPVQVMAAVDLQLGLVQRQLETAAAPEDTRALLDQMRSTVSEANDRLRYLLFDLDSPAQREDVETALGEAAAYVLQDTVRWDVRCEPGLELDETARVLVYRIAKEAMVNVRKHAQASRVHVHVCRREGGIEVVVTDDGVGLPPQHFAPRPGHRGVSDMRDRAAIAGGSVTLTNGAERGAVMRLWIPLSAHAD